MRYQAALYPDRYITPGAGVTTSVSGKPLFWLARAARGRNYTHRPRDRQSDVAMIISYKCRRRAWRATGAHAMIQRRIERAGPEKR